jgi:hypothetical protein
VLYEHVGSKTLQEIASEYDLPDAYAIINSEYNAPCGATFQMMSP